MGKSGGCGCRGEPPRTGTHSCHSSLYPRYIGTLVFTTAAILFSINHSIEDKLAGRDDLTKDIRGQQTKLRGLFSGKHCDEACLMPLFSALALCLLRRYRALKDQSTGYVLSVTCCGCGIYTALLCVVHERYSGTGGVSYHTCPLFDCRRTALYLCIEFIYTFTDEILLTYLARSD